MDVRAESGRDVAVSGRDRRRAVVPRGGSTVCGPWSSATRSRASWALDHHQSHLPTRRHRPRRNPALPARPRENEEEVSGGVWGDGDYGRHHPSSLGRADAGGYRG